MAGNIKDGIRLSVVDLNSVTGVDPLVTDDGGSVFSCTSMTPSVKGRVANERYNEL